MAITLIRDVVTILCCCYLIKKMLVLNKGKMFFLFSLFVSFALALLVHFVTLHFPEFYTLVLVGVFAILFSLYTKKNFTASVSIALLSFAVVYALMMVCSVLVGLVMTEVFSLYDKNISDILLDTISALCVGVLVFLAIFLFFKIKRFKNGIPNVETHLQSDLAFFTSISVLFSITLATILEKPNTIFFLIVIFVCFTGLMFYFWWKNKLSKIYLEQQRLKEIASLNQEITEKESRVEELLTENKALSSLIHRDNKIVNAFVHALDDVLKDFDPATSHEKLSAFSAAIKTEHAERLTTINTSLLQKIILPKTNVFAVDALLDYMKNKAGAYGIAFDLALSCSVNHLCANIIQESDLVTLLADLAENAIIATKNSKLKKIFISFAVEENAYTLAISDSGETFPLDVLENFGTKRNSTHIDEGGSGIGLVTIFALLQKYHACLCIEEFEDTLFTKKITITFLGETENSESPRFRIKSPRTLALTRPDVEVLSTKEKKD